MAKLVECEARQGYQLWLRYEDGTAGTIYLGNLIELGAFAIWRDEQQFRMVRADNEHGSVVWEGGVRLDSEILRHDITARIAPDESFGRFMERVLDWDSYLETFAKFNGSDIQQMRTRGSRKARKGPRR